MSSPRERGVAFLSTVVARRASPSPAAPEMPAKPKLSDAAMKLLMKSALEPGTFLVSAYSALGLHPHNGKQALDELLALNMVRVHRFVRKGRGAQPAALEILDAGLAELNGRGIAAAEKRIPRGGFKHDIYGRWLKLFAEARGLRVAFERTLGEKCFDVVTWNREGEFNAFEICLSGSAPLNANAALKGASVAGVQHLFVCCEDQKLMKGIVPLVSSMPKIYVKFLGEFFRESNSSM